MPLLRGLMTLRRCCALLALTVLPLVAGAADSEREKAILLDQNIQVLKDEVLQLNRDAQTTEENFYYPDHSRVEVFVSVETPAVLLQKVTVRIDSGQPITFDYDDTTARALVRSKGVQRLGRFNVTKGAHRVTVEFTGRYGDGSADGSVLNDRIEAVFDKTLAPTTLELIVGKARRGGKPALRVQEWRPAS